MDVFKIFSSRLLSIESYLRSTGSNRHVALGRILEAEQLAFSFRNENLMTVRQFDQLDHQFEALRRFHNLHASSSDLCKPYNGRFLSYKSSHEDQD